MLDLSLPAHYIILCRDRPIENFFPTPISQPKIKVSCMTSIIHTKRGVFRVLYNNIQQRDDGIQCQQEQVNHGQEVV
jgi:hypothetical protein